jgi:phosphatidylglycerophosphate synthase
LAFPWLPAGWRAPVVLAAALSDLLDGLASRRLHAGSAAGRILDPVADKVFVLGAVGALISEDTLPLWQAVLAALRDLAVLTGTVWVLVRRDCRAFRRMRPSLLGKAVTVGQFLLLLVLLLRPEHALAVLVPTAVLSGLAAQGYLLAFLEQEKDRRGFPGQVHAGPVIADRRARA